MTGLAADELPPGSFGDGSSGFVSVFIIEKGEWKINHLLSRFDKVRMIQLRSQILLRKIFLEVYKTGKTGNPMISTKEKD